MKLFNNIRVFKSTIEVEIEGYFVERYINLCRSSNIEIWDIKQLTAGKIRFTSYAKNLKKMKSIVRKSKCRLKVLKKNGIYFKLFKYRKRRIAMYIFVGLCVGIYVFSKFIWKVNVEGNTNISDTEIFNTLKEFGIHPGLFNKNLDKGKISDILRAKYYNIAWVGVEVNGINLDIEIIEKNINNLKEQQEEVGNIVATKSATISSIIATNGTALLKKGETVTQGETLIEGKIYYTNKEPIEVHASGVVRGIVAYDYTKEYIFKETKKIYTDKVKRGFSIYINNKEFEINYLPKDYIYDKLISKKKIKIFGNILGFSFNKYVEYEERQVSYTREELIENAKKDFHSFITEFCTLQDSRKVIDKLENIEEVQNRYKV